MPAGRPFVGAVTLELLDAKGERIAANYVNLVVRRRPAESLSGSRPPSNRRLRLAAPGSKCSARGWSHCDGTRTISPRFAADRPEEWTERRGKFYAYGRCEVRYDFRCRISFATPASPGGADGRIGHQGGRSAAGLAGGPPPMDYPQTQQRKYPGTVSVWLSSGPETAEGEAAKAAPRFRPAGLLGQFDLPDDPADSRGVLSHLAGYQHGSYGYLVRAKLDLTESPSARKALIEKPFVPLVFRADGDGCGLSIYGERLGRYPIDPMIIIETAVDLSRPVGWTSTEPVMTDRLLDRRQ